MASAVENEQRPGFEKQLSDDAANKHKKSLFEFRNVCFTVKATDGFGPLGTKKEKLINNKVSGRVESGRVLAILGPSGAGKSTLLNALTLNGFGGETTGDVTLDGKPLTEEILRQRGFVVAQEDHHWTFLTCKETLVYAAALYCDESASAKQARVQKVIERMGLESCQGTRVGNEFVKGLSGGQKRRLSLGVALVKNPDLIFLDEPTSGLDAASAAKIMVFIKQLAKRDNLIIITTIHQPSTAVFNGFDQAMILSQGREAYVGDAVKAVDWFAAQGHHIPENTNPADFCLDLVNADFAPQEGVKKLLDAWESGGKTKDPGPPDYEEAKQEMNKYRIPRARQMKIMCRDRDQSQVLNKTNLMAWLIGPNSQLAVIAVYAYNADFKAIRREMKNGMVSPVAYVIASSIMQIPMMFIFTVASLAIPAYVVTKFNLDNAHKNLLVYAVDLYAWECMGQFFSIVFDNPLIGMMAYVQMWFTGFVFAGWLIRATDIIWPLRLFNYALPLRFTLRSMTYLEFIDTTWEGCDNLPADAACWGDPSKNGPQSGADVLDRLGEALGPYSSESHLLIDVLAPLAVGGVFKVLHAVLLIMKTRRHTKILPAKAS